tara:strand:- start:796 stop:1074 length:279 start_codon:yes stop_codon:yes gene_type:complete
MSMYQPIHDVVWISSLMKEDLNFRPAGTRHDGGLVGFGPENLSDEDDCPILFRVKERELEYDDSRLNSKQLRAIEGIAGTLNINLILNEGEN